MSRKHYRSVAEIIAAETAEYNALDGMDQKYTEAATIKYYTARNIAYSLADMFKQDNPRFDRQRFYDACGIA